MIVAGNTRRPRNVDVPRAAAILYGDWGTSKAYVIGLAFAVGSYSSFWLIAAMCLLTALVGVNYMAICRHYPDGGGVYASVRHRSVIISIVGAFLLVADYIVTAALSALSAFDYFGVSHPERYAAGAIVVIGLLNVFGPKHTGGLAFLVSVPTAVVVFLLGLFCLPHLGQAAHNVQPLAGGFFKNWKGFVGVVLALSGVEAIANSTGVMKLNAGTTDANPNVSKTSTPAILWVMFEVCIFTALLGLAMCALPNLTINATDPANPDVDAPGHPGVRDYMLRYMGQVFVGHALGHSFGVAAGIAVSVVFGLLLLSAVNTAIVDLIAISFLMSRDGELPPRFQRLNQFGVPNMGLIVATVIPAILVLVVKDMGGLADLYAVGVVGAIATNLGACSTDRKLGLVTWERMLMFITFLIMLAIEISLFAYKPSARIFAMSVLLVGLVLRGLAAEYASRTKAAAAEAAQTAAAAMPAPIVPMLVNMENVDGPPMMCAIRGLGKTLDFAIDESRQTRRPLYLLFVRSLPVLTEQDYKRKWQEDDEAREVFLAAKSKAGVHPVFPCYAVSDSVATTIVDITATMGASYLILGAPERKGLASLLRGSIIREVSDNLPDDIHLLVYA
ncbi:MAG TPA: universal stress protein [Candidatus Baltobacteraceae bacterium]|jgi:amino acid transporter/nucleotide-binding universal stress UspA family protein|nr:universal stress protein [Candidatus Baltobacteraceae bacterium]